MLWNMQTEWAKNGTIFCTPYNFKLSDFQYSFTVNITRHFVITLSL